MASASVSTRTALNPPSTTALWAALIQSSRDSRDEVDVCVGDFAFINIFKKGKNLIFLSWTIPSNHFHASPGRSISVHAMR
jgi:hypothetical protein